MADNGYLEIGCTTDGQVSMIHPKMPVCAKGGFILFTPEEARHLASLLTQNAERADSVIRIKARGNGSQRRRRR